MPFHTQRIVITTNKGIRRMTQNKSLIQTHANNKRKVEWFILTEGLSLKDAYSNIFVEKELPMR